MDGIRQVLAVLVVLGLLAAALCWLQRRGLARLRNPRGSRKGALIAADRLVLGPQHSLHLVHVAGRALLVSTSPAGCRLIESFDWASLEFPPESREVRK